MVSEHALQAYRQRYARLLRLYPEPYRERFCKSMEQTFADLCREREKGGLFVLALWVFVETFIGIIKEHIIQNTMNMFIKATDVVLILGFLAVDFFFFHDFFKAGEIITPAQYLTGFLSILVFVLCVRSLLGKPSRS